MVLSDCVVNEFELESPLLSRGQAAEQHGNFFVSTQLIRYSTLDVPRPTHSTTVTISVLHALPPSAAPSPSISPHQRSRVKQSPFIVERQIDQRPDRGQSASFIPSRQLGG